MLSHCQRRGRWEKEQVPSPTLCVFVPRPDTRRAHTPATPNPRSARSKADLPAPGHALNRIPGAARRPPPRPAPRCSCCQRLPHLRRRSLDPTNPGRPRLSLPEVHASRAPQSRPRRARLPTRGAWPRRHVGARCFLVANTCDQCGVCAESNSSKM